MEEDGKLPGEAPAPPLQRGRQRGSSSGRTGHPTSRTSHDPVHPHSFPFMAPPEYEGFSPPAPPLGPSFGPGFGPFPLDLLGGGGMFFPPHVNIRLVRPPGGSRHRRGGRRENSGLDPPSRAEEGGENPGEGEEEGGPSGDGSVPNDNANEREGSRRRRSRSNNEHAENYPARRRRRGGSRSRSPDWRRQNEGGQQGDFPFFGGLPPRNEWGGGPWPFGGRSRSPSVQSRGSWSLPNRTASTPRSRQVVHNTYVISSHGTLNIYGGGPFHFTRRRHEEEEEERDEDEQEEEGEDDDDDYDRDR